MFRAGGDPHVHGSRVAPCAGKASGEATHVVRPGGHLCLFTPALGDRARKGNPRERRCRQSGKKLWSGAEPVRDAIMVLLASSEAGTG